MGATTDRCTQPCGITEEDVVDYLALAVAAAFIAAFAQGAVGVGFSLLLSPVLQILGEGREGVRLLDLLSLVVNALLILRLWNDIDWRRAGALAFPAAALTPLGAWLGSIVRPRTLEIVVAVVVLASVALLAAGWRAPSLKGRVGGILAGGVGGALNALTGVSGPTVTLLVANAEWPSRVIVPTLQVYFFTINGVAIAFIGLPTLNGSATLQLLVGGVVAGVVVGAATRSLLPPLLAERAVLGIAAAGAIAILL